MITSVNNTVSVKNLSLSAANGSYFNLTGNASGFQNLICRNCLFKSTTQTSVAITSGSPNDILIEDCTFSSVVHAYIATSTWNSVAYRNVFKRCFVDNSCTNGFVLDCSKSLFEDCTILGVTTMNLQLDAVGGVGVKNAVKTCLIVTDAYETDCSSDANTIWNSSYCSDVANTDVSADGAIITYPNQA